MGGRLQWQGSLLLLSLGDWGRNPEVDVLVLLDDSLDPKTDSRRIWGIAYELCGQHEIDVQPVVVAENTVPDRQRPALLQLPA